MLSLEFRKSNFDYDKCYKIRTLAACEKGLEKQYKQYFPVCYSSKHFANSSPENLKIEREVFKITILLTRGMFSYRSM